MYRFVGGLFLTRQDQDLGFPAFRRPNENLLHTCILDKELSIVRFVPVYTDQFFFIPHSGEKLAFDIGTIFSFLTFRLSHGLFLVDLYNSDSLAAISEKYGPNSFINLQTSRYIAGKDQNKRGDAIKTISRVAETFTLDNESRISFISSEGSLLSSSDGAWSLSVPPISESLSSDDIFGKFVDISKMEAAELLKDSDFKTDLYWPYLYIIYHQKFGNDEFLFILGREYVGRLLTRPKEPTPIMAQVIMNVLRFETLRHSVGRMDVDWDLADTLEELIESPMFPQLYKIHPPLVMSTLNIVYVAADRSSRARALFQFLTEHAFTLPDLAKKELSATILQDIKSLEEDDVPAATAWLFPSEYESPHFPLEYESPQLRRRVPQSRAELVKSVRIELAKLVSSKD